MTHTYVSHLECVECGATYSAEVEQHLCVCGGILLARYELARLAAEVPRDVVAGRAWSEGLWRYAELLPVAGRAGRVSLGEGATPLLPLEWLSAELDALIWLKDEGINPTGTFKARGAAVGVSRARELGARAIALPTAGNAGAAWAAYGARAGIPVVVAMPQDAPPLTQQEVRLYGAHLHLVDGLISDAGPGSRSECGARGGTTRARLKSRTGSRARRRWGWRSPSNWAGSRRM